MRDPKRIDRILKLIGDIWHYAPDLRLGQLLYNYGGFSDYDYSLEDDLIEKALTKHSPYMETITEQITDEIKIERKICPHHQKHPDDKSYYACTCSTSYTITNKKSIL